MGGTIGVESTPGRGSTLLVRPRACRAGRRSRAGAGRSAALRWHVRVLVVDDNATNREILQQQLRRLGHAR
ncbi:MAG: hypothetical protein MZV65_35155 [Chromatiales bacterium]|nr:hypothetical protein [Chromatiales bacterium]